MLDEKVYKDKIKEVLKLLCPSKATFNYWQKISHEFTEEEILVMLVHGYYGSNYGDYNELVSTSKLFRSTAKDESVIAGLDKFINALETAMVGFKESKAGYAFVVSVYEKDYGYSSLGITSTYDAAYRLIQENAGDFTSDSSVLDKGLLEDIESYHIKKMQLDEKFEELTEPQEGYYINALRFSNDLEKIFIEYDNIMNPSSDQFVRNRYITIPFPFKECDLVYDMGNQEYCLVYGSDDWKANNEHYGKCSPDEYDIVLTVEYLDDDGDYHHSHIDPRYLNYGPEEDTLHYHVLKAAYELETGKGYVAYYSALYKMYLERVETDKKLLDGKSFVLQYDKETQKIAEMPLRKKVNNE